VAGAGFLNLHSRTMLASSVENDGKHSSAQAVVRGPAHGASDARVEVGSMDGANVVIERPWTFPSMLI
jgi:hypothetical protein